MDQPGSKPLVLTQHRVKLPAVLTFTVTTEPGMGKDAIRQRVQNMLRRVFDDGKKAVLRRPSQENDFALASPAENELQADLLVPTENQRTPDGETIYPMKGLTLLYSEDIEVAPAQFPKWREERF